jgi:hypothetical protein
MLWHRSRQFFLTIKKPSLLLGMAICGFAPLAVAAAKDTPIFALELYRRYATINENSVVRKFEKTEPFAIQAICLTHLDRRCSTEKLSNIVKYAVGPNNRLRVAITKENPDLQFFFTDRSGTEIIKKRLSEDFKDAFQDFSDLDCQLYFSMDKNTIERASIVVSLDASGIKQRVCLTLQLPHAMGLALPNAGNFANNWPVTSDGIDLSKASDKELSEIKNKLDILTYIHLCPDLKPGMNSDDIEAVFSNSKSCLKGLRTKSSHREF